MPPAGPWCFPCPGGGGCELPKKGPQPLSGGRKRADLDVHSESFSRAQTSLPGDGRGHPAWRSELAGLGVELSVEVNGYKILIPKGSYGKVKVRPSPSSMGRWGSWRCFILGKTFPDLLVLLFAVGTKDLHGSSCLANAL